MMPLDLSTAPAGSGPLPFDFQKIHDGCSQELCNKIFIYLSAVKGLQERTESAAVNSCVTRNTFSCQPVKGL